MPEPFALAWIFAFIVSTSPEMAPPESILRQLSQLLAERKRTRPADSYTTKLLDAGLPKIAAKISEEAAEVIEAAGEPGLDGMEHTTREAADLIYHLQVLLAWRDVEWEAVEAELARRFGISGLAEKAARAVNTPPSDSTK
ncbi:MAG: phosphoribosyl-ATP diphosphatase [Planctomycetaceae bacterium]|nr:phosphoribosyl-ATP diphosphatase [Planctomycetaceae bacterium]